jgi:hypothetical protein
MREAIQAGGDEQMTDNQTTGTPNCDVCGIKKIYVMRQELGSEASKLARETIKAARERRVDIGELIKYIANEYAASEAPYAQGEAYSSSYAEGYSDGFEDGRKR